MYNQQIINERLDKIQATLSFKLERHTYSEIESAVDYINNLIKLDDYITSIRDGKKALIEFKDQRSKKEYESEAIQQFIYNETIISKFDCFYWMNSYYKISDITNTFIQYKHSVPQQVWAKIFSRLEGLQRAIRLLVLKARQTTCTTFSQGVVEHRLQFYPDVKSLIASKDQTSSGTMATMFINSLSKQPFWLRPQTSAFETGSFWQFDNGSRLDLGWGTQKSLAKGTTCTVAHLSEIALFKYWNDAIENALIRAMHETIWLLQIFEGTAEARDDDFHTKVKETISGMERGTSSLYFSFVPYFLRDDIYPPPAYIAGRSDSWEKFIPSLETIAHARKAENWVKANPDLREILGSNYKMSRETMFWYQTEKDAAIREDRLNVFLSQVPADWEEAFQHAGRTIFPIEIISYHSDQAQSRIPEVYKLRGDSSEISPDFWPRSDEILEDGKIITIRPNWTSSIPPSHFELVQIKFEGWDKFDPIDKVLIWEHPRLGAKYGSGIDPSDGLGPKISDDATIEIYKDGTVETKDMQVCEFASPNLSQLAMGPFSLAINTYYSPEEQLLLAIEDNKGFELQNWMIKYGWSNLYKTIDESKVGQDLSKIQKYGFHTDGRSRVALISHFNSFIIGKYVIINSLKLIGECKDLEKNRTVSAITKVQNDKISGKVDNRYMASGICMYALHRDGIAGYQKAAWEERIKNENSKVEIKTFSRYDFEIADFNSPKNENEMIDDELMSSIYDSENLIEINSEFGF